jgi:hypothetical protein
MRGVEACDVYVDGCVGGHSIGGASSRVGEDLGRRCGAGDMGDRGIEAEDFVLIKVSMLDEEGIGDFEGREC